MKRRMLPRHVSAFRDRHGKERLRFRRTGQPTYYFKAPIGSDDFLREYHACMARLPDDRDVGADRIVQGTVADLMVRYRRSTVWRQKSDGARHRERLILEPFLTQHGDKRVAKLRFEHLDFIIGEKAVTAPFQAQRLRKLLKQLLRYAVKIGMIERNVADDTEPVRTKTGGFHTWTEDEIAQYQAFHPLGTKPRLALELMLWTGQRRSDAIVMGRQHIANGSMRVVQRKTGTVLQLEVVEQLRVAIAAMPPHDHLTFLVTEYGRPFTSAGFGNWFRDQCDAAGLPHCTAHGLRKAMSRRLAELGLNNQSLKAVGGWKRDDEVAVYTQAADQKVLARRAIRNLSRSKLANPTDRLANDKD
jgi:integrase